MRRAWIVWCRTATRVVCCVKATKEMATSRVASLPQGCSSVKQHRRHFAELYLSCAMFEQEPVWAARAKPGQESGRMVKYCWQAPQARCHAAVQLKALMRIGVRPAVV